MGTKAKTTADAPIPPASEPVAMATETAKGAEAMNDTEPMLEPLAMDAIPLDSLVASVLASPAFVDGVVLVIEGKVASLVDARMSELFESEDFKLRIAAEADHHFWADDSELVRRVNEHLDANLPDLVKASMPEADMPTAAALLAERSAPIVDDRAVEAAAVAEREQRSENRDAQKAQMRDNFAALLEGKVGSDPLDLSTVKAAKLLLDDGRGFSIDFTLSVPVDHLSMVAEAVLLAHPAIAIGDDMPEAFTAKGVVLVLEGVEGFTGLRCEMAQPIVVGGGMRAQLGENSLLFRAPR